MLKSRKETEQKRVKEVKVGGIYKHFKGELYQVIAIATRETDIEKRDVIYRSIMNGTTWSREISLFASFVDTDKYPNAEQKYRMEYVGSPKYGVVSNL